MEQQKVGLLTFGNIKRKITTFGQTEVKTSNPWDDGDKKPWPLGICRSDSQPSGRWIRDHPVITRTEKRHKALRRMAQELTAHKSTDRVTPNP